MITGVHTLIYAEDPEAARAFFRDVLRFPCSDTGGGWLIFKTGPSELGTHPSSWEYGGTRGGTDQAFDVSLMCDDISATMAELGQRGAEFDGDVVEQGWGHTVRLKIPDEAARLWTEHCHGVPQMHAVASLMRVQSSCSQDRVRHRTGPGPGPFRRFGPGPLLTTVQTRPAQGDDHPRPPVPR